MTKTEVLVIEPDYSHRYETIDGRPYDGIKALLNDGWLESVGGNTGDGPKWVAYGDEEGQLKRLTPNVAAAAVIAGVGSSHPVLPVGTIVIAGLRYAGAEDGYVETDVPDAVRSAVTRILAE